MTERLSISHGSEAAEYFFREGCFVTEWWNTPDDARASVARARVAPGAMTRWHCLQGVSERYVILSGSGRVEVGDAPPVELGAGDVVLIPSDTAQRIFNSGLEDLVFLAICTPRFVPEAYQDLEVTV